MSRRPNYLGGNTIVYVNKIKGKYHDCIYRCKGGDCSNRSSQYFGEMCGKVIKCKDYSPRIPKINNSINDSKITDNKKTSNYLKKLARQIKTIKSINNHENGVKIGDSIILYSHTYQNNTKILVNKNIKLRSPIAEWAIGKDVGSKGEYNNNVFEITKVIKSKSTAEKNEGRENE